MMLAGKTLHRYGASSDRVESALILMSQKLNIKGEFFATPTALFACFKIDDEVEDSRLKRLDVGKINLSKLLEVDHIVDLVLYEKMKISDGTKMIQEIIDDPPLYSQLLISITYFCISFFSALLIGGNTYDALAAGSLSFLLSFFGQTIKIERLNSIFEGLAAFILSMSAIVMATHIPQVSHSQVITLASMITLIPGLMLTTAIGELASNNLAAGTARLTGSIVILLKITFGVYAAHLFSQYLNYSIEQAQLVIHPFKLKILFAVFASFAFAVNYQVRIKEAFWVILISVLTFSINNGLMDFTGSTMSIFLSGCFLAAMSNIFSRTTQKPALTVLLPGIILMVPGSVGYQGVELLFKENSIEGINTLFKMMTIAISLVSGTYFGSVIVKPKRSL